MNSAAPLIFTSSLIALAGLLGLPATTIAQTVLQQQGQLESGDAILRSDGSLYDQYTFAGQAGQQIQIRLQSSEFDTYLILLAPDDSVVAENDDVSQTTTDSEVTVTLPSTGTYRVIANGLDRSSLGRYVLTVQTANTATAQNVSMGTASDCAASLTTAKEQIGQGRNVTVEVRDRNLTDTYPDFPANRPLSYTFILDGAAADDVMNSPQFMQSISTGIITNCESISQVTFNVYQTDWVITFGLIGDRVEKFQCVFFDRQRPWLLSREVTWGYMHCL